MAQVGGWACHRTNGGPLADRPWLRLERTQVNPASCGVPPRLLEVGPAARSGPLVPARLRLSDRPSGCLFNPMAPAAASARVAGIGLPALVVRHRMLKIGLTGGPGTGRERALVIADLDQAAEPVARRVGVDPVPVVAVVRGHDVEPHGQSLSAGQGQCPRAVPVFDRLGGEFPVARRRPGSWPTA